MDVNTIEVCWNILQQYIKPGDRGHAVNHLMTELSEAGIRDEDLGQLADIDSLFSDAVEELTDHDDNEWDEE
jgi:hypothetical protein